MVDVHYPRFEAGDFVHVRPEARIHFSMVLKERREAGVPTVPESVQEILMPWQVKQTFDFDNENGEGLAILLEGVEGVTFASYFFAPLQIQ